MSQGPPPPPRQGSRYLLLLLATVVWTVVVGLFAAVAVAALVSFVPPLVGVLVGMLFGLGLPLFLALRALAALKRKNSALLLRRILVAFLLGATQLAVLGSVLQFTSVTLAHVAATAAGVLHPFGGVPALSGLLESYATKNRVALPYAAQKSTVGPDGGTLLVDGGMPMAADGGVTAPVVDAGTVGVARKLSERAVGGLAVRTFAVSAVTSTGDHAIFVGTLRFGGRVAWRVVDMSAHQKLGPVTSLAVSDDGVVAAVLGGTHTVISRPGRMVAELHKGLSRGALLDKKLAIEGISDLVVAPGGDLLLVVTTTPTAPNAQAVPPTPALVLVKAGVASVLRKYGDPVPDADEQSMALGFTLQSRRGDGRVVVVESFREGSDEIAPKLSGEQFVMNPSRLSVGRIDQPKALLEVARTDLAPSGIDNVSFQAFADAAFVADGRAIFDANFAETGPSGWLFSWRAGGTGAQAIAPELMAMPTASLKMRAPRHRMLDIEPDGAFVLERDGAVVWSTLKAPATAVIGLKGAVVVMDGRAVATVDSVDVPMVGNGGEFVVASASVNGGDAIVLASKADMAAGVCEGLLLKGAPVPVAAATEKSFGHTIKTMRVVVRDEVLWAAASPIAPALPAAPALAAPPVTAPPVAPPPAPAPPAPAPPAPAP